MPFGLNQAQYFFQYYMDCHFQDINSMTNVITDDVMIHEETDEQHDRHLIQVLNKCHKIGLKLNPEKFYGNTISADGVNQTYRKLMS